MLKRGSIIHSINIILQTNQLADKSFKNLIFKSVMSKAFKQHLNHSTNINAQPNMLLEMGYYTKERDHSHIHQ